MLCQLALHYSDTLLPGDDLRNTHKPYIITIMHILSLRFLFSSADAFSEERKIKREISFISQIQYFS